MGGIARIPSEQGGCSCIVALGCLLHSILMLWDELGQYMASTHEQCFLQCWPQEAAAVTSQPCSVACQIICLWWLSLQHARPLQDCVVSASGESNAGGSVQLDANIQFAIWDNGQLYLPLFFTTSEDINGSACIQSGGGPAGIKFLSSRGAQ